MKQFLQPFILLVLSTFIFSLTAEAEGVFKKLSVEKCDSLIKANDQNPNFVILDVRTPASWNSGHLVGSIYRNYYDSNFDDQLNQLPKHKIFLIHCQSGGRSGNTFNKMKNMGFSEVYDMIGGMNAWKGNSYPTTTQIEPRLMLVSTETVKGNTGSNDTLYISITNRANGKLTFSSINVNDVHETQHDFDLGHQLEGAEDVTFSIVHSPLYSDVDTTSLTLVSNGGTLELDLILKDGVIQKVSEPVLPEIVVYPNPASSSIRISGLETNAGTRISLYNIHGQEILTVHDYMQNEAIDISGLNSGIFIIHFKHRSQLISKKILISR